MDQPQAQCSAGTFTGNFKNNLNIFYGIPYAKPLEMDTQWLPPEPLTDPICLDAYKRGYTAPQTIYEKSFFHDQPQTDALGWLAGHGHAWGLLRYCIQNHRFLRK